MLRFNLVKDRIAVNEQKANKIDKETSNIVLVSCSPGFVFSIWQWVLTQFG